MYNDKAVRDATPALTSRAEAAVKKTAQATVGLFAAQTIALEQTQTRIRSSAETYAQSHQPLRGVSEQTSAALADVQGLKAALGAEQQHSLHLDDTKRYLAAALSKLDGM
ncbi:hypothetical protein RI367_004296 [Sorochytrium milnesiophthora]